MTHNFNILVEKLNSFKSKYYTFRFLRGLIVSLAFLLVIYTFLSVTEYFIYLSPAIRKTVFFGFIIFSVLLLFQFVLLPVLKLFNMAGAMDLKSTSKIIQHHFSGIEDKLLNVLELRDLQSGQYSNELILAIIDQKIDKLKVFDFNEAIDYKNIKYISIYLLISFLISMGIFVFNKKIFVESTNRLVHYNTTYLKPAPFTYLPQNSELRVKKGDSFTVQVKVTGSEIPEIVYINIEGNNYLMKSTAQDLFEYELVSVINPVKFYFTDLKYESEKFNLILLPKPGITSFKTSVYPPAYTGIQNQVIDNLGDLQVPNGTRVEWNFSGIDIDSVYIVMQDSLKIKAKKEGDTFVINSSFYQSAGYNVYIQNSATEPELALSYNIEVIPDIFPEIEVHEVRDSLQLTRFFYKGSIGDDYGFSKLNFHFNF